MGLVPIIVVGGLVWMAATGRLGNLIRILPENWFGDQAEIQAGLDRNSNILNPPTNEKSPLWQFSRINPDKKGILESGGGFQKWWNEMLHGPQSPTVQAATAPQTGLQPGQSGVAANVNQGAVEDLVKQGFTPEAARQFMLAAQDEIKKNPNQPTAAFIDAGTRRLIEAGIANPTQAGAITQAADKVLLPYLKMETEKASLNSKATPVNVAQEQEKTGDIQIATQDTLGEALGKKYAAEQKKLSVGVLKQFLGETTDDTMGRLRGNIHAYFSTGPTH
jgi:hypothetical protein